jgi:DNA polymerase-3 subunit alpha
VVAFPDVFARCTPLLDSDRPLLVTGEAEAGENVVKIRAQDIVALETVKQRSIKSISIPIPKEGLARSSLMKLRDLVFRYPGDCQIIFKIRHDGNTESRIAAHNRYSIMPDENLIREIESLVGNKIMYHV